MRICAAKFGSLVLFEGNAYRRVALHNAPAVFVDAQAREPVRPLAASPTLSRIAETKQIICYADILAEQPEEAIARLGGARTVLCVPMLKDDRAVGAISIYRQEVRPFTDKQMELLTNFASQAVIAIENTRLLNELRESLQQQTATADVLKVISSSPGELEPVFNAMLENAVRICEAKFGVMHRFVGEEFYSVAHLNLPEPLLEFLRKRGQAKAIPGSDMDNLYKSKQVVHTIDMLAVRRAEFDLPNLPEDARNSPCRCSWKANSSGRSSFTARKCGRLLTSRSSCSRTSLRKRSSPSKTRACSTSCANRCSSRPPPPTCSRSLAVRPAT